MNDEPKNDPRPVEVPAWKRKPAKRVPRHKILNVPMRDGSRLRFSVHRDGSCYELSRNGHRKVRDEAMRAALVRRAWGEAA